MKKLLTLIVLMTSFILPSNLLSFDDMPQGGEPGNRREKLREKLETMRNWKIIDEFNLDDAKAKKVFTILKETDDERAKLLQKRQESNKKLKEISSNINASEAEINSAIQESLNVNVDIAKIRQKEINNLKTVFSPKELIRYMMLQEQLMREIGQMMKNKMPDRPDGQGEGASPERRRPK